MEEEPSDPHEQQLFAVFKSCLAEGKRGLDKEGLLMLCDKLELEENHKDSVLELLEIDTADRPVSFYQFRDSFLAVLGKCQEGLSNNTEREVNGESQGTCKNITMCTVHSQQPLESKQSEAVSCQQLQKNKVFDQRLQETWSNQNSLTIEDVNSFCNRGSVLPKQTIELIFEKLDIDCDGLINRDEFSHFFQSASSKIMEHSNLNWSMHLHRDSNSNKSDCGKDFIHHQTGYVTRSSIIDLWEVAGVSEANSLLVDLGFDAPTINLIDLSNALSSELKMHRDISHAGGAGEYVRLLKAALTLYQEEVRNLNTSMEHLSCERDKLRSDIGEANERAHVLAQEIDEHQAQMDRAREEQLRQLEGRHAEALRELTEQLQLERERAAAGTRSLEEELRATQCEEQRIRAELAGVLRELRSLEAENQSQAEEIARLEAGNSQLARQVQELAAAHDQVESIETRENEQVSDLMDHIKRLQSEMKILRDHNDELTTELEMSKHRDNDAKSIVSSIDIRSTMSDENEPLVSMPTTEVSDTEDEEKQQQQSKYSEHSKVNKLSNGTRSKLLPNENSNGQSINKLSEIIQEFRNYLTSAKFCAECSPLRLEVSSLISELELYQSSVPTIPTTTSNNKRKKQLKNLANELEAECKINDRVTESSRDLVFVKNDKFKHYKRISTSDETLQDILDENLDNSIVKGSDKKAQTQRDYPSRKSAEKEINKSKPAINKVDSRRNSNSNELLKEEEEVKHEAEKKALLDRCNELEKSLEMLKSEYEQCEDYWSSKLEEERQLFEQEQKISDEKFNELIVKMAEYEEQFNPDKSRDGRLSPIEERVNLEQQYNDLEAEFEKWRLEAQGELQKREHDLEELREKLRATNSSRVSADICVQCPDEQMENLYPNLYTVLCGPGSSAGTSSPKVDAAVQNEPKSSSTQQCPQCHKSVQNSCDCQASSTPQQGRQRDQRVWRKNEGKGKHHHHHHQKRMEGDYEFNNLMKQKERLRQEIMKLQSIKNMSASNMYPLISPHEQNVFSTLYSKLYAQEQKQKYQQMMFHNHQKENERILHNMWKQHLMETSDLRYVIQTTEEKLNQQIKINKEQSEKLTKADFLTKELYVENAQLSETIKRLEQHCQILTENRIESTSA